jgi:adenosylcobinamide-GDP ribazoletransferase
VADERASKSKPLVDSLGGREIFIAAAWCVPPLLLASLARGIAFIAIPLALTAWAWWRMKRLFAVRLQGFTGDALGATQQVCEIAFYFGAAIACSVA